MKIGAFVDDLLQDSQGDVPPKLLRTADFDPRKWLITKLNCIVCDAKFLITNYICNIIAFSFGGVPLSRHNVLAK